MPPIVARVHAIARFTATGLAAAAIACGTAAARTPSNAPAEPMRIVPGLDEPLIATAAAPPDEQRALDRAIRDFRKPLPPQADFAQRAKPLEAFLAAHRESAWRMSILTDLGIGYYRDGYLTRATDDWKRAWEAGREARNPQAKALADRAVSELARMHARLGHAPELDTLFADVGDRPVTGPATEMMTGAHEGLWLFKHDWGTAYLCGPMALKNLLIALHGDAGKIAALDEVRSGPQGFTLAQVSALADDAGLPHRLVYRAPGQAVPVPAIVNWRLNHFAAIIGVERGRYHVVDPTFASGDLWMTQAAIDEEASGFFLVPAGERQQDGWRIARGEEARAVYGMGNTTQSQPGATTPNDADCNCLHDRKQAPDADAGDSGVTGMAAVNAKTMLVSLNLKDTPVGYRPAFGPSADISVTYNQREASQPSVFTFFNVSPKWTLNLLSWVQDDPNAPGASVMRYVAGGGSIDYSSTYTYNSSTGEFSPERQGQAVLVRIPATGPVVSYKLLMPDGSAQVFGFGDGATAAPRRMFLTQLVDPAGNALTLTYDAQKRLTFATDATGRRTTFGYANANPLLVTRITDPFGRSAALGYDTSGRLSSITDVLGLTSSFAYDGGGLVNAMTTPYGTHRFAYGSGDNNERYLEMTDPMGFTERLEFVHGAPGIPLGDPVAPPNVDNIYLYYRNTFFWDKNLYPVTHTDYTQAQITHWLHNPLNQTSPIIESTKEPLENRVWRTYPGQPVTYVEGSADTPLNVERVLDSGATQSRSYTYNPIGKPLTAVDPLGRKTVFTYAANNVDLVSVQQQTTAGGTLSTVASFTYTPQTHLRLTYVDAAGQTTRYGYNAAGELTSVTNALNQTTSYAYDALGRLTTVINANGVAQQSLSYDQYDRVATRTDSEGYTLSYTYDAMDRVTAIRYPDGTTTQYGYDRLDLASATDRLGHTTRYAHDANRRLTQTTDALGLVTRYGYYRNGQLASLTDPRGDTTTWDVDIENRVTAKHYADGRTETYSYEASTDRLKRVTDALGQNKTYAYNNDDSPASIAYANTVNPTPNVSFGYDAFFPRRTSMSDGIGATTWAYYPPGVAGALRLASETGPYAPNINTVSYGYDALGRVSSRTVDSATESFAYDALGRPVSHASALGSFNRTYLGQTGQLASQASTTGTVGTQWQYETNANDRRLHAVVNSGAARSFTFQTLPENLITGITQSAPGTASTAWSYGYDNDNRLTSATTPGVLGYAYGYDGADNLTSLSGTSATYNNVNQVNTLGGAAYAYDANGNLLNDGVRSYAWDAEKRLVGIGYIGSPGKSTGMRYDGLGRRLGIIENAGGSSSETRYLWCGDSMCQARTAADVVIRRYFPEGQASPQNSNLYYGTDQLGSVRNVSSVQNGATVASYDYDPYGNQTLTTGQALVDFRYAGMFYHAASGLYLTNYRAYDPKSARWLSRDPIGEVGGTNVYGYVDGNPVSYVDPSGLGPVDSPSATLRSAIARGDVQQLKNLLEALGPDERALAEQAIQKYESTAGDWISQSCKGSINREFPGQLRDKTLKEILDQSKSGDAVAKKAWKLLNDNRFQK
jgi:RHS repeat-associated protein